MKWGTLHCYRADTGEHCFRCCSTSLLLLLLLLFSMMPGKKTLKIVRLLRMKILLSPMVLLFPYKFFLVLSALCLCSAVAQCGSLTTASAYNGNSVFLPVLLLLLLLLSPIALLDNNRHCKGLLPTPRHSSDSDCP